MSLARASRVGNNNILEYKNISTRKYHNRNCNRNRNCYRKRNDLTDMHVCMYVCKYVCMQYVVCNICLYKSNNNCKWQ